MAFDGQFVGSRIILLAGPGSVHEALIVESTASSNTFTFDPAANAAVTSATDYEIIPAHVFAQTTNQGYTGGAIIIDSNNGNAGTILNVNGTDENPVDNLADAITLAGKVTPVASKRFNQRKGSSITLSQTFNGYMFNGRGGTVVLNGRDVSLCTFISQSLSGVGTGSGRVFCRDCLLTNVTLNDAALNDCAISGAIWNSDQGSSHRCG